MSPLDDRLVTCHMLKSLGSLLTVSTCFCFFLVVSAKWDVSWLLLPAWHRFKSNGRWSSRVRQSKPLPSLRRLLPWKGANPMRPHQNRCRNKEIYKYLEFINSKPFDLTYSHTYIYFARLEFHCTASLFTIDADFQTYTEVRNHGHQRQEDQAQKYSRSRCFFRSLCKESLRLHSHSYGFG